MESSAPTSPPVGDINTGMASPQLPPAKRKTIRAQDEERHQQKDVIADTTLTIIEINVDKTMARTNISVSLQRCWLEAQDRHPRAVASSLEDEHSSSMVLRGNADPLDVEQF
ncbi:unnamed protein product [Adineta steineri]|uniref:Uncharacterized protein n=1 Tax=Adineta steineri TaxID=433720 RepID=A0A815T2J6_9BILA|nr:unnamed protein product [Adineta steineri]CAF1037597.1 unnamed protein product [Adineta steineri]CAF1264810.1 unnamed protein product [Adineta steineri]CAF1500747.1 unnamed protein product [Adineta steineri]